MTDAVDNFVDLVCLFDLVEHTARSFCHFVRVIGVAVGTSIVFVDISGNVILVKHNIFSLRLTGIGVT